jgi:hypothetical protein
MFLIAFKKLFFYDIDDIFNSWWKNCINFFYSSLVKNWHFETNFVKGKYKEELNFYFYDIFLFGSFIIKNEIFQRKIIRKR